jgi:hypothetical protein
MELKEVKETLEGLAEPLKKFIRAIQGLSPEDYIKMTDWSNLDERARLTQYQIEAIAYRRLVADTYPDYFGIFKITSDIKEHLSVTKEGEQRKEEILMQKAKTQVDLQPLAIPPVITKPEKKHFWQKSKQPEASEEIKA